MPYGYYTILKVFFFGALTWFGMRSNKDQSNFLKSGNGLFLILALILYNPFLQIHLGSKILWLFLNIGTVIFMMRIIQKLRPPNETEF
jgi:hypothetical protein